MRVTIDRLGHLGDGIAPGPVYAPRTLPGEVVEGEPDGDRLTDLRIIDPSGDRVTAPCRHYRMCGGCQVQHASDAFVAGWKTGVVQQALAAQGLETELRPIATSPPDTRRRASFAARRTKSGALAGFHARASDTIIDTPDCRLLLPDLRAALPMVRQLAGMGASRKAALSVSVTASGAGLDVLVKGGKPLDLALRTDLGALGEAHDIARLTWDSEPVATRRAPWQQMGRARVVPPPGAFLQATLAGEAELVAAMREIVGNAGHVADLFAGCGTFTLPLAGSSRCHAVEAAADMLRALDAGWRLAEGLKQVTTETRDLFRDPLAAEELDRFDAIVLDPPRAGAEAQCTALAGSGVGRVAYVSCNPVTFARDARHLVAGGFRLNWVQPIDQFRWSSHIELAASFTR